MHSSPKIPQYTMQNPAVWASVSQVCHDFHDHIYQTEYPWQFVTVVVQEPLKVRPVENQLLDEVLGVYREQVVSVCLADHGGRLVQGNKPVCSPSVVLASPLGQVSRVWWEQHLDYLQLLRLLLGGQLLV